MGKPPIKFAGILLLLLIIGCSKNPDRDYAIKYTMIKLEKKFGKCDTLDGSCAKISLYYPEVKQAFNEAVRDSLTSHVRETLLGNYFHEQKVKSLDEMAKLFFSDYEGVQSEPMDYRIGWELNNTISIIFNNHSIVSFQSEFYHFTGGAHGMSGTYFTNFNSQDGKKLTLLDLLNPGYEQELNSIAERIFRKNNRLTPDTNLEEAGFWFEEGKFSLNENFGIKNDGLIFYFNSYEIAPYAMGPTEIVIPYTELKSLINEVGLLQKILSEKVKDN